jgi:UDP-N-acetylglucosamine--N-acetylmuramyl-(pentapeptide) pyrophosphoryl-undecaprenol N-acetylglucosamine transferase
MSTVIFAGGGTGGHLFPGIAVARELAARDLSCVFMGSGTPIELRETEGGGFPFRKVRLSRRSGGLLPLPLHLLQSACDTVGSALYYRKVRPVAVVGLGAASMIGPVAAAVLMRVPRVLMEQNVLPGRATRLVCRVAAKVLTSWERTAEYLPSRVKTEFLGNPVRQEVTGGSRDEALDAFGFAPGRRTVLVLGGSQGAAALNRAFTGMAQVLAEKRIQVIHLSGQTDEAAVRTGYEGAGTVAKVMSFCDDMGRAYAAADLVVSRAGGSATAEIAANGKAAVLVPFPYAVDRHQDLNGKAFCDSGAGVLVEEGDGFEDRLRDAVVDALGGETLSRMEAASAGISRKDAAARTAEEIMRIAGCST